MFTEKTAHHKDHLQNLFFDLLALWPASSCSTPSTEATHFSAGDETSQTGPYNVFYKQSK